MLCIENFWIFPDIIFLDHSKCNIVFIALAIQLQMSEKKRTAYINVFSVGKGRLGSWIIWWNSKICK